MHHVVFAVARQRHDAMAQLFTDLGFGFETLELTELRLHVHLDWNPGIELISPIPGSTASVAAFVTEFLDSHGDGVHRGAPGSGSQGRRRGGRALRGHNPFPARLRGRDHPELTMPAVEESMRHSPAVCSTLRTVSEDVEFSGFTFPSGTFIFVNTFAANCDPAIYDDADRFDITRESPPAILTFGGGVHYCLGANLDEAGACRSAENPRTPDAEPPPRRTGTVEAAARHERADQPARRVRHLDDKRRVASTVECR